ncbi:MAG: S8 family serine peptidase [Oscillospiraceae bacterium]|nr:S8 family serine peptidase [Oscillospiraceae bacterium]
MKKNKSQRHWVRLLSFLMLLSFLNSLFPAASAAEVIAVTGLESVMPVSEALIEESLDETTVYENGQSEMLDSETEEEISVSTDSDNPGEGESTQQTESQEEPADDLTESTSDSGVLPTDNSSGEVSETENSSHESPEEALDELSDSVETADSQEQPSAETELNDLDDLGSPETDQAMEPEDLEDLEDPEESEDEEDEESELPCGFAGLPEGYVLSEAELAAKRRLAEHEVAETVLSLQAGVDYIEGEVLLLSDSPEYASAVAEAYSAELTDCSNGVAVLTLKTATVPEAVAAAQDPGIPLPAVEPNYIQSIEPVNGGSARTRPSYSLAGSEVPEIQSWKAWYDGATNPDPYLSDPTAENYQYMHDMVNTYEAWGVSTGSGITVAILDSGVTGHEELNNLSVLSTSLGTDNMLSHGTYVAGIIAAAMDNGTGGAGIAPDAGILSVRVFNSYGSSSTSLLVRGINAIVSDGRAQIINMSLGSFRYSASLETAIQNAVDNGITVVAAMGNSGSNMKYYPAALDIPGVIAVSAVTDSGSQAWFSNYGTWADVSAPGAGILTTSPGGYSTVDGTSMAAPVISGICALYMSACGNPGPATMEQLIRSAVSGGIVDSSKLFAGDRTAPEISAPELSDGIIPFGETISISAAEGASNGACILYTLDGKNPSVRNGYVLNGTVYSEALAANAENGFAIGSKVTLKAACVSGMGVLGNVSTLRFTVGYADPESVTIQNIPDSEQGLCAGKSLQLNALVSPSEAEQSVVWSIEERDGCSDTTINTKTGLLKTGSDDNGTILVRASAGNATCTETIKIQRIEPVKSLVLDQTAVTLNYSSGSADGTQITATAYDASKTPVSNVSLLWSSSDSGIAEVDDFGNVTAVGKGKAVIRCKALDGSNKTAVCAVTVRQLVDSITISGQTSVIPGKSAVYRATALPTTANNRSIIWSVSGPDGVTVSSSGCVKIPKNVGEGNVIITAEAKDGSGVSGTMTVEIREAVSSVQILADADTFRGGGLSWNTKGDLKQAVLYSVETDKWNGVEKTYQDASLQLNCSATDSSGQTVECDLEWSSSRPSVASVDDSGLVTALSAGTTVVSCRALDGSGKKGSVTIRVINPVSSVTVASSAVSAGESPILLAAGKSASNRAVLGDAFGKPSIRTVNWNMELKITDDSGFRQTDLEETVLNKKWIALNSRGMLTTRSNISEMASSYTIVAIVSAATIDGTELDGSIEYAICPRCTEIMFADNGKTSLSMSSEQNKTINLSLSTDCGGNFGGQFIVKSSNPNVAGAYISVTTYSTVLKVVTNNTGKTGTAYITVTAADGSNRSCKLTLKVS